MNGLIVLKDTANTGCVVPSNALTSISVANNEVVANFNVIDTGDSPTVDSITFTVDGTVADAEHKVARDFADLCKSGRTIVLDDVNADYEGLADVSGVAFSLNGADSLPSSRVFGGRTHSTATVTLDDTDSGKVHTLNRAAGITVNLPDITASRIGQKYIFDVKADVTSNAYIIALNSGDVFRGMVKVVGGGDDFLHDIADPSSDDLITMSSASSNTTGGKVGTRIVVEFIEAGVALASGYTIGGGTAAAVFGS